MNATYCTRVYVVTSAQNRKHDCDFDQILTHAHNHSSYDIEIWVITQHCDIRAKTPISVSRTYIALMIDLQSSIPLCVLHVPTPAARLQNSRTPYLYISTSTRLQRTPRAPELQSSMPPTTSLHRLQSSRTPYLYTSTSTRLQRISRAPELHTSTPTLTPFTI